MSGSRLAALIAVFTYVLIGLYVLLDVSDHEDSELQAVRLEDTLSNGTSGRRLRSGFSQQLPVVVLEEQESDEEGETFADRHSHLKKLLSQCPRHRWQPLRPYSKLMWNYDNFKQSLTKIRDHVALTTDKIQYKLNEWSKPVGFKFAYLSDDPPLPRAWDDARKATGVRTVYFGVIAGVVVLLTIVVCELFWVLRKVIRSRIYGDEDEGVVGNDKRRSYIPLLADNDEAILENPNMVLNPSLVNPIHEAEGANGGLEIVPPPDRLASKTSVGSSEFRPQDRLASNASSVRGPIQRPGGKRESLLSVASRHSKASQISDERDAHYWLTLQWVDWKDVFFLLHVIALHALQWEIMNFALDNGLIFHGGQDYELIFVWLLFVMASDIFSHAVAYGTLIFRKGMANHCVGPIAVSVAPVLGPRNDLMRDYTFTGLCFAVAHCSETPFKRKLGIALGWISWLSILIPFPFLFWNKNRRHELRTEFLPALNVRAKEQRKRKAKTWMQWAAAESTEKLVNTVTEAKFYNIVFEDGTQALCNCIFASTFGGSLFVYSQMGICGLKISSIPVIRHRILPLVIGEYGIDDEPALMLARTMTPNFACCRDGLTLIQYAAIEGRIELLCDMLLIRDNKNEIVLKFTNLDDEKLKRFKKTAAPALAHKVIDLDFASCVELTNSGISVLSQIIPASLDKLALSFGNCRQLTSDGVEKVWSWIPEDVKQLELDFSSCSRLSDAGVKACSKARLRYLQQLRLSLANCYELTDDSVEEVKKMDTPEMLQLSIDLSGCDRLTDTSMLHVEEILSEHPALKTLTLRMNGLRQCTDDGLRAIGSALPETATQMHLSFQACYQLTDASVGKVVDKLPEDVTELSLDFSKCHQITDCSFEPWAAKIFNNLGTFHLHVDDCYKLTDAFITSVVRRSVISSIKVLTINAGNCHMLTDNALQTLANEDLLLEHISLKLGGCHCITDQGVVAVADLISPNLKGFNVDFSRCSQITDDGVQELLARLHDDLEEISLNFSNCHRISDQCMYEIPRRVGSRLTTLALLFDGCCSLTDGGLTNWVDVLRRIKKGNVKLTLSFKDCCRLTDESVERVLHVIPWRALEMNLNFAGCSLLTDRCLQALAPRIHDRLATALLDFSFCSNFTTKGIKAVIEALPATLTTLRLSFYHCHNFTDEMLLQFEEHFPPMMERLTLRLGSCRSLTDSALITFFTKLQRKAVRELELDLSNNPKLKDVLNDFEKLMPPLLTRLSLNFERCMSLAPGDEENGYFFRSEDMDAVSQTLEDTTGLLTHLSLNLNGCKALGNAGLRRLSHLVQHNLSELSVKLAGCTRVSDDGLLPFIEMFGTRLTHVGFELERLTLVTDHSIRLLAKQLPDGISHISLNFAWVDKLTDSSVRAILQAFKFNLVHFQLNVACCEDVVDCLIDFPKRVPSTLATLQLGFEECMRISQGSFRKFLAAMTDAHLMDLALTLNNCTDISDPHIQILASGLAPTLKNLSLNFTSLSITDESVEHLAKFVPKWCAQLELSIAGCHGVTAKSLREMLDSFPQNLVKLGLDLSGVRGMGTRGVIRAIQAMPRSIMSFRVTLDHCVDFDNAALENLVKGLPKTLSALAMQCMRCKDIDNEGLNFLAWYLNEATLLRTLHLNFQGCDLIQDAGAGTIAQSLPCCLSDLELKFHGCSQLSDTIVYALSKWYPPLLMSLVVEFFECRLITDESVKDMLKRVPREALLKLDANFQGCKHLGDEHRQSIDEMTLELATRCDVQVSVG